MWTRPDPGWAHRHDRRGDGDRTRPSAVEIMLDIEHMLATAVATFVAGNRRSACQISTCSGWHLCTSRGPIRSMSPHWPATTGRCLISAITTRSTGQVRIVSDATVRAHYDVLGASEMPHSSRGEAASYMCRGGDDQAAVSARGSRPQPSRVSARSLWAPRSLRRCCSRRGGARRRCHPRGN